MQGTRKLLTAFILLALAGCTDPPSSAGPDTRPGGDTGSGGDRASAAAQLLPRVTQSWKGDFDGMVDRRLVRVLTVYGPGRYYLDGGRELGLVAELMGLFEQFINEELQRGHLKVHVAVIPVARDQLLPGLLSGRGDLAIAGLTITPERAQRVDFTIPWSNSVREVLVTGPAAPPVKTIEDLAGETIHVRASSSYYSSVQALNQRLRTQGKPAVNIEPISELLEDDDLIEMVNGGLLPWAIVDDYKIELWDGVFDHLVVRDDIVFREGDRLGWAMRPDSPELLAISNAFLRQHREGTLLGNVLRNRYIRDFDWAANALDKADYQRFTALADYFRTYGDTYDIQYLLAAAQGYQESGLDQSVRSAAGAVGVMQLLPSTAADPNVGIGDITNARNNIHAGVKYLSFLRERYFSGSDIDPFNQTLLALAAYNAGPARVAKLRAEAAAQGYDPNRWFDNVEVIAAQEIGRETVEYVANIYKYYLSYRLSALHQDKRNKAREAVGID